MADLTPTGFDGVLQYSATVADPPNTAAALVSVGEARDVNCTIAVDKTEVTDRRSRFKRFCPSMIDVEITTTVTYTASSKEFIERCLAREVMTIACLHESAGEGMYITAQCFTADLATPLSDGMTIALTFAPVSQSGSGAGGDPVWV